MHMLDKVLILSASAGTGHIRAGEAIKHAILQTSVANTVSHLDTLEYTNPLFRRLYSKAHIETVKRMPDVLGWLHDWHDKPWHPDQVQLAFDKLEEEAALRCNNLPAIAYKIDCLLDDPAHLATMRQNVRRLARPRAAFDIAAKVVELHQSGAGMYGRSGGSTRPRVP